MADFVINREVFTSNGWLIDDHIDHFAQILRNEYGFAFCHSWKEQMPNLIDPLDPSREHIQLLASYEGSYSNGGHWVCSYYDGNQIYIFDSMGNNKLHFRQKKVLERLFPFYDFHSTPPIFPKVQRQQNGFDCGVFAAAFATSLVLGEWPGNVVYNPTTIRLHMLSVLENNKIMPFPKIPNASSSKHIFDDIPSTFMRKINSKTMSYMTGKREKNSEGVGEGQSSSIPIVNASDDKFQNNKKTAKFSTECDSHHYSARSAPESPKLGQTGTKITEIGSHNDSTRNTSTTSKSKKLQKNNDIHGARIKEENKRIICQGDKLTDNHMYQFKYILSTYSDYNHRDTLFLTKPWKIEPVHALQKHIQILFSRRRNHWVCSFYDTQKLYIYDSLQENLLDEDYRIFLKHLYPFLELHTKNVMFPRVQQQRNLVDCGVFAIAIAVSLLYKKNPEYIKYDEAKMRPHLYQMFDKNVLQHFPISISTSTQFTFLPLETLRLNEKKAFQKRLRQNKKCKDSNITSDSNVVFQTPASMQTATGKQKNIYPSPNIPIDLSQMSTEDTIDKKSRASKRSRIDSPHIIIKKARIDVRENYAPSSKIMNPPGDVFPEYDDASTNKKDSNNRNFENHESAISGNGGLTHQHMQQFKTILSSCSDYDHRDTSLLSEPWNITPVDSTRKHIQILYDRTNNHWVCSFYDAQNLFLYDSSNAGILTNDYARFLERLYPFYLIKNESIKFCTVQQQPHSIDSGIFAIAFAISLLFRKQPQYIMYDYPQMRAHLNEIFRQEQIVHFPIIIKSPMAINLLTLEKIRELEKSALYKRVQRQKIRQEKVNKRSVADSIETSPISPIILKETNPTVDVSAGGGKVKNETPGLVKSSTNWQQRFGPKGIYEEKKKKHAVAATVISKYCRMYSAQNTIRLKLDKEEYIQNLMSVIEGKSLADCRLEAEKVVKWCIVQRQKYIYTLKQAINVLKNNVETSLSTAGNIQLGIHDRIIAMCGTSRHTDSTEPYFYETAYLFNKFHHELVMNKHGQVANILPIISTKNNKKIWCCDNNCRVYNESTYNHFKKLLLQIRTKTIHSFPRFLKSWRKIHSTDKLGHFSTCYTMPCTCESTFYSLMLLSPHFPRVRYMKRLIEKILQYYKKLRIVNKALNDAHLRRLYKIMNEAKSKGQIFSSKDQHICLDEDEIQLIHKKAFLLYTNRLLNTVTLNCISCQKLCYKKDVVEISKQRNPIVTKVWKDLLDYVATRPHFQSNYICIYCVTRIRKNDLPPRCILNNLDPGLIPNEIINLNTYGKLLIQRAKAFQTVQRMGTVMKKKMPVTAKFEKVIGQTFYLPLSTEETLAKICPDEEAINKNHELFILIRGLPTKSKKIWEHIVDIKEVFNALRKLKAINPLYSKITLPQQCENLLPTDMNDVQFEYHVENEDIGEKPPSSQDNNDEEPGAEATFNVQNDNNEDMKIHIDDCDNLCDQANAQSERVSDSDTGPRPAFLTQILDENAHTEHYTIYPMYDKREHDTSSNLYQMIKIQENPLNSRLNTLDLLCFPDLYPHGVNGQHETRSIPLPDHEYIKLRLLSSDPRFRLNHQYLFHLLHDATVRQLNAGIYHTLNILNPREKFTAGSYLQRLGSGELEANLRTIFSRLRNSAQFWISPRNDLFCMTRHYGPATWFLTLSPAEWLWDDMIKHIRHVNAPHLDKLSEKALIAADPVTASRFIENKFQAMLAFILSEANPIGKVVHYFWRREYQGRGTPHFHLQLWVEGAPVIGVNTNEEIAEFIMKYVTCTIPNKGTSPTLYRRVTTHQAHTHNSYCLRTKKEKSGNTTRRCRFGFPRPVTDEFVLRDPAVSIAGRRNLKSKTRLYDLPRTESEKNINDYNPVILTVWEGNMDIQFIGESSSLLTRYCTKYITKPEKTAMPEVVSEMNSTKTLRQLLWNIAFRAISNREIGAMEAADTLLGHSLYGTDTDTTIRWLDVRMIRNRKLKTRQELEEMEETSTEIFCPSLIDNHYPNRPKELELISLHDFAQWYDIVSDPPVRDTEFYKSGTRYIKKRKRPHLINHYTFNVNTEPEKYFYALLLLFQPWRDTNELKNKGQTYRQTFESRKDDLSKACQYHEKWDELQKGLDYIEEQIAKCLAEDEINEQSQSSPIIIDCRDPSEVLNVMKDFKDMDTKAAETLNLSQMMKDLNPDQTRVFNTVVDALKAKDKVLRLYVSGEGGTGKSFLIDALRCWTKQEMNKDVAVTAPTGIAAYNIKGLTIHKLFQLPVQHGFTPRYTALSDQLLKIMRDDLRNVELIIIDEVSMISNLTLMYINLRLIEIFNTFDSDDGWFGGKHILLFGDLLQLPPVHEGPPYASLTPKDFQHYIGSMGNVNLWETLFSYDELIINMRQQNDQTYRNLLGRMRLGATTDEDVRLLETRKIPMNLSSSPQERLAHLCKFIQSLPLDTVCLLSTREQCRILNTAMVDQLDSEEIILTADDIVEGSVASRKKAFDALKKIGNDETRTASFPEVIKIKIGAKVMVRRNIDVTKGLVNGTIGIVISVNKNPLNGKLDSITIRLGTGEERLIEPMSVKFEVTEGIYVTRKQFPIGLSYGITVHKSQGLSLQIVVVDIGMTIFSPGQTYVALSRVRTMEGLHLINFDPHSIKANHLAIAEYNRLRGIYRPDLQQLPITHRRLHKVWDRQWLSNGVSMNIADNEAGGEIPSNTIHGFQNSENTYSYANAVMQCFLHLSLMRKSLGKIITNCHDAEFKAFIELYLKSSTNLSTKAMRDYVGGQFCEEKEQDPWIFIEKLCEKNDVLNNFVKHRLKVINQCKLCQYAKTDENPNYVIRLPMIETTKSIDLNTLISRSLSQWHDYTGLCEFCNRNNCVRRKIEITSCENVLVLSLDLFLNNKTKTHALIKAIPTSKVNICGNAYKVKSAIFYDSKPPTNSHFKAMIRDIKSGWIEIDDLRVEKGKWPYNGKNAYILFLEKLRN